ncbi:MAG: hypothetical protein K0S65_6494, partial [Labilithrix sp.]|nr:hypothetical protein [Labilithrix sp.]
MKSRSGTYGRFEARPTTDGGGSDTPAVAAAKDSTSPPLSGGGEAPVATSSDLVLASGAVRRSGGIEPFVGISPLERLEMELLLEA